MRNIIIITINVLLVITIGWMVFNSEKCEYNVQTKTETCERLFGNKKQKEPRILVYVKYRDTGRVNLNHKNFEYQDTSKSSFIGGVWYDDSEDYMIIKLKDTYYHYCSIPHSVWESFQEASSFGSFYDSKIKGNYSCQVQEEPNY